MSTTVTLLVAIAGSVAAANASPPCADHAAEASIADLFPDASSVYVVTPSAATAEVRSTERRTQREIEDRNELFRVRDQASESGRLDRVSGTIVPFDVERTIKGEETVRLSLPAPGCTAPAYLVILRPSQPAQFVPLAGVEDPRADDAP